ncbi:prepilin-type N-terminal cleavage/methylation domain-containing protein [bacterium]|nr:prepilin-type N-terminal cleavage/methylation domain-containing protein [bacterium]
MKKKTGFTLAEVMITLAIIGVVAAMTIPTLIADYQKKQWVTGLQKGYAMLNQVFKMAMAVDGVECFYDTALWKAAPKGAYGRYLGGSQQDHSAFVAELGKYMKIASWQNPDEELGFGYKNLNGEDYYTKEGRLRIFGQDGMIYYFAMQESGEGHSYNGIGVVSYAIEIDVNGKNGPNQYGRDLFELTLLENGQVIFHGTKEWDEQIGLYWSSRCNVDGTHTYEGDYCGARIFENGWRMDY